MILTTLIPPQNGPGLTPHAFIFALYAESCGQDWKFNPQENGVLSIEDVIIIDGLLARGWGLSLSMETFTCYPPSSLKKNSSGSWLVMKKYRLRNQTKILMDKTKDWETSDFADFIVACLACIILGYAIGYTLTEFIFNRVTGR